MRIHKEMSFSSGHAATGTPNDKNLRTTISRQEKSTGQTGRTDQHLFARRTGLGG
jgi:hypothetical protein